MGINIGAFLSAIIIGGIGEVYGWHFGFGLAGIGMLLGQLVFVFGQKYLIGIGDFIGKNDNPEKDSMNKPLTNIEKDRVKVLLLSFMIVIVFWGAFEQAGGLMNIYAFEKTDRMISSLNFEVPATWFQSLNAGFIVLFAVLVGKFWSWWKSLGRESALLFQMAVGVIIMAMGFAVMSEAALQDNTLGFVAQGSEFGFGKMYARGINDDVYSQCDAESFCPTTLFLMCGKDEKDENEVAPFQHLLQYIPFLFQYLL